MKAIPIYDVIMSYVETCEKNVFGFSGRFKRTENGPKKKFGPI